MGLDVDRDDRDRYDPYKLPRELSRDGSVDIGTPQRRSTAGRTFSDSSPLPNEHEDDQDGEGARGARENHDYKAQQEGEEEPMPRQQPEPQFDEGTWVKLVEVAGPRTKLYKHKELIGQAGRVQSSARVDGGTWLYTVQLDASKRIISDLQGDQLEVMQEPQQQQSGSGDDDDDEQQQPVSVSVTIEESIRAVAFGMRASEQEAAEDSGDTTTLSPLSRGPIRRSVSPGKRPWSAEPAQSFRPPENWRVDGSLREAALSVSTRVQQARVPSGPLPTSIASRIPMSHGAPKTLRLRDLQSKPLPRLVAWSVDEWKGLLNAPALDSCLLEVTAAHRLLFRRDLNELSRMLRPPPSVALVMEAVVILLGYTPRVTYPPAQLPPFRSGVSAAEPAAGSLRGETNPSQPQPQPQPQPQQQQQQQSLSRSTKCVDYSDAVTALLRDPLRLATEIENETPPRVTAGKVKALRQMLLRNSFGTLELSQLPSVNASLALYYWAVATINYCFAKAATSKKR